MSRLAALPPCSWAVPSGVALRWLAPWLIVAFGLLSVAAAHAQALVQRPFPATALRGTMTFGTPPEVLINEVPARLAPGVRIRGGNNLLVMSATLVGQRALVHYTLEPISGLVLDVWLLRDDEVDPRKPWPTTVEEQRTWSFDPVSQTWTPRR
jgi:hypothetical protein